jgi:hypothetical protein
VTEYVDLMIILSLAEHREPRELTTLSVKRFLWSIVIVGGGCWISDRTATELVRFCPALSRR